MKLKIFGFVFICLLLVINGSKLNHARAEVIIQEDPEIAEQKVKLKNSMRNIASLTTGIADYITDFGVAPEQAGIYDENSEFYNALVDFYLRIVPIMDEWGNDIRVYCGEACNDIYSGISGCSSDDFVIVSYGRDGKKEDWGYNRQNREAGFYMLENLEDFDKDIVNWNGAWIRSPHRSEIR